MRYAFDRRGPTRPYRTTTICRILGVLPCKWDQHFLNWSADTLADTRRKYRREGILHPSNACGYGFNLAPVHRTRLATCTPPSVSSANHNSSWDESERDGCDPIHKLRGPLLLLLYGMYVLQRESGPAVSAHPRATYRLFQLDQLRTHAASRIEPPRLIELRMYLIITRDDEKVFN